MKTDVKTDHNPADFRLLVLGDPAALSPLQGALSSQGVHCAFALSPQETLKCLVEALMQENPFHLVLTDDELFPNACAEIKNTLEMNTELASTRILRLSSLQTELQTDSVDEVMRRLLEYASVSGGPCRDDSLPKTFDATALNDLRTIEEAGAPGFVRDMLQKFLETAREQVSAIERALSGNDLDTIRRTAHSLKSASAMLGALRLSEYCKFLERSALNGAPITPAEVEALAQEYRSVAAIMTTICDGLQESADEVGRSSPSLRQ